MAYNKYVLGSDAQFLSRRSQSLSPDLIEALLVVCKNNPEIQVCYVLDAKKPNSDEEKILIAVSLDDEKSQLEAVAIAFQNGLRQFPVVSQRMFILSSQPFVERYAGAEFYRRNIPGLDSGMAV